MHRGVKANYLVQIAILWYTNTCIGKQLSIRDTIYDICVEKYKLEEIGFKHVVLK